MARSSSVEVRETVSGNPQSPPLWSVFTGISINGLANDAKIYFARVRELIKGSV